MLTMAIPDVEILVVPLWTICFQLFFSADDTNVYSLRTIEIEGSGSVYMGLKVVKSCSCGALPIHLLMHFCCRMYRLATMHSIIVRRTDDIMMPITVIG